MRFCGQQLWRLIPWAGKNIFWLRHETLFLFEICFYLKGDHASVHEYHQFWLVFTKTAKCDEITFVKQSKVKKRIHECHFELRNGSVWYIVHWMAMIKWVCEFFQFCFFFFSFFIRKTENNGWMSSTKIVSLWFCMRVCFCLNGRFVFVYLWFNFRNSFSDPLWFVMASCNNI